MAESRGWERQCGDAISSKRLAVHKETAVACLRIVEDGEVSRCRQNLFRGLAINA